MLQLESAQGCATAFVVSDNGPIWYGNVFSPNGSICRRWRLVPARLPCDVERFVPRFLKQSRSRLSQSFVVETHRVQGRNVAEADAVDVYRSSGFWRSQVRDMDG